jgi:type IV secretory pathway VirB4 component
MPDINIFAETDYRGWRQRFGIKREDRRLHMYVIGRTGMGKTTLLLNLLLNDISVGEGGCFIDPHGDAV